MRKRCVPSVALFALLVSGCGGSQLTPEQEVEYQSLQAEEEDLIAKLSAAHSERRVAYREMVRLSSQKKLGGMSAITCDVDLNQQSIGPLPFVFKRGYRVILVERGERALGARRCMAYKAKVVR